MRMAWATDIHLNFLEHHARALFFQSIIDCQPDVVCVTGDIAETPSLIFHLHEMEHALRRPLYVVLGNHDFYFGSIEKVRLMVQEWCQQHAGLTYLSDKKSVELTPRTVLVGVDGWGDGRYGEYWESPVRLNDQACIEDFRGLDREGVLRKLHCLGDEAAESLFERLPSVMSSYRQVLVATHVPPFKEACWYEGKTGNNDWLPYFTCKAVGEVLLEMAQRHASCQVIVLCGHTHHAGSVQILPNLKVLTGSAEYGQPRIEHIFQIE
ncbi:MAG: metallophosphoesterase family protein [Nitrospiraceae bacterium]|nr:metallophosphoesterase family protein [Nitrospiraceae bacterium]